MDSIEVAKIKPGQTVTFTLGEKEVTLTRGEEPGQFTMEGWCEDDTDIYLLDPVIEEDELLHYSLTPMPDPERAKELNKSLFGVNKVVFDFLARPLEDLATDGEEDDEEEED